MRKTLDGDNDEGKSLASLGAQSIEWNAPEKTNCYSTFNLVEQWKA